MTLLSRRSFLRSALTATGVAIVAPELLVPEEPRRRVWQVGAALARPSDEQVMAYTFWHRDEPPQVHFSRPIDESWVDDFWGRTDDTAPALRQAFANEHVGREPFSLRDIESDGAFIIDEAESIRDIEAAVKRATEPTGSLFGIKPGGYPSPAELYVTGSRAEHERLRDVQHRFDRLMAEHVTGALRKHNLGDEGGV